MKTSFFLIICLFLQMAQAETIDLTPGLYSKLRSQQGTLRIYKRFIEDDGSLIDPGEARKIARFFTHPEVEQYALQAQRQLEGTIRDARVLNAVLYLMWVWNTEEQKLNTTRLLELYYSQLFSAVKESAGDPRLSPAQRDDLRAWITQINQFAIARRLQTPENGIFAYTPQITRCLSQIPSSDITQPVAEYRRQALTRVNSLRRCLLSTYPARGPIPFAMLDLRMFIPAHPGSVISESGFIPGNKVQVLNINRNTSDAEYTRILEAVMDKVIKPYEARWDQLNDQQQITQMKALIQQARAENKNPLHAVFIEAAGGSPSDVVYQSGSTVYTKGDALNIERNPVWQYTPPTSEQNRQTFPNIVRVIKEAKSTVFIDLFFYGGSMGLAMTDLLSKELARKPQLKILLLRDDVNHFGHRAEMKPVFNYVRAMMSLDPQRIMAVPSNIFDKRVNGYPEFFKNFLSNESLRQFGFDERMSLYIKAQSDHSKILVVDGDQPQGNPRMIVGSKNWTDASGAVCNDEAVLIEGPAAVVALDNYYDDIYEGLKASWNLENTFWKNFYEDIYQRGWSQEGECKDIPQGPSQHIRRMVQMLCPFDVVKRYRFYGQSMATNFPSLQQIGKIEAKVAGPSVVRLGENNTSASIVSINNQNIQAIHGAKKQILIHEQLLYAVGIVEALKLKAKQGVEVKVILEGFLHEGSQFPGMPNLLYLDEMKRAGIQVKWKIHEHSNVFAPEHHGKTISIDGWTSAGTRATAQNTALLIIGSANKDLLTMKGGFRESQAEIFDLNASKDHDMHFWRFWNDPKETRDATFEEFDRSPIAQQIKSRGITTPQFMRYVTEFLQSIYSLKPIAR